jgi:hypothetical protein
MESRYSMKNVEFYSKNKGDLFQKITMLINSNDIETKYKDALSSWMKWFEFNYDRINLPVIQEISLFYRAYYESPNTFAIQLWKEESGISVCKGTVYSNSPINDQNGYIDLLNISHDTTYLPVN